MSLEVRTSAQADVSVLVLNHQRDPLDEIVAGLRAAGYRTVESTSLADTRKLTAAERPAVVLLNPLLLRAGGVESELIERLQLEHDPVPVILLVEDARMLQQARTLHVPLKDFLVKPYDPEEVVHRVELALLTRSKFRALHDRARELEGQVSVDFKTGLLSDRHFRKVLHVEWKRAQRHHDSLSLMLVDVDNFKVINDTTEYAFGDEVLRRVAATLKQGLRETDFAARYGGDEFVLLLPQTSPAEAVQTAIRLRKLVASLAVENGAYQRSVTISIGIDTYDGRSPTSAPDELWRRANKALHEAKKRGKDRVWLYAEGGGEATTSG